MKDDVEFYREANAAVVKFVRPELRNPLSVAIVNELSEFLTNAARENSLERVIFTGSDNVFAAGADLREIMDLSPEEAASFARLGQSLMQQIAEFPRMTVAAVNGFCFGGALDLAIACDKRIASPAAKFAHPGANLGIMTGWGGTQRLPRLIGEAAALELFFTAAPIGAKSALRIGLVDRLENDPLAFALSESCLP